MKSPQEPVDPRPPPPQCENPACGKSFVGHHPDRAGRYCSQKCYHLMRRRHSFKTIELCRHLWDEGCTVLEIAFFASTKNRTLNKNQIIGIANRNGFPKRPSPIKRTKK